MRDECAAEKLRGISLLMHIMGKCGRMQTGAKSRGEVICSPIHRRHSDVKVCECVTQSINTLPGKTRFDQSATLIVSLTSAHLPFLQECRISADVHVRESL